jgi:hypothetical protein
MLYLLQAVYAIKYWETVNDDDEISVLVEGRSHKFDFLANLSYDL